MADEYIHFECGGCGKHMKALQRFAGREVPCVCGTVCKIPLPSEPAVDPEPAFVAVDNSKKDYSQISTQNGTARTWKVGDVLALLVVLPVIALFVWIFTPIVIKSPELCLAALVLMGVLSAVAFIFWVIAWLIGKPWYVVVAGFFGMLLASLAVFGILAGLKSGKVINFCSSCGHSWYPRNGIYSARCPGCGKTR